MSHDSKTILLTTLALTLFSLESVPAFSTDKLKAGVHGVQRRARPRPAKDSARERREKSFQLVWQTVKNEHFDPTFGGVNWDDVRTRYARRVANVKSDQELHALLQLMLNELPQSHFAIIPPDRIPRLKSKRTAPAGTGAAEVNDDSSDLLGDEAESEGGNDIATRMMNGIGIDVRLLNGQVVITRVDANGPAAKAGLRPGYVIKSIDDVPFENLSGSSSSGVAAAVSISPLISMRLRQRVLLDYLGGEPGTEVQLVYLDEQNREREALIKRERLAGSLSPSFGNVPPLYTELEAKRLAGEIGYIRFTVFTPQVAEKICRAVRSMRDAPGIVIDLRGNPGGIMGMASGIVGLVTDRVGLIGILRTRTGTLPIPTFPQRSSYKGPLVILIDRLTGSTAEVMAATLQESKRAVIVGEQSAGVVLGADFIKLPTGALFEYARTGFKTSQGETLEGKGVRPDVISKLDRSSLLKGQDEPLQEALRQIETRKGSAEKTNEPAAAAAVAAASSPPPAPVNPNAGSSPTVITAVRPVQENSAKAVAENRSFKSTPQAEMIMERYVRAVGGKEALERLKSRVSVGVCTFPFQNLTGRVVIYEQAPDKRSMEVTIPNVGVLKMVFDGRRGWIQHPLMGFFEYGEEMASALRREYDFYKITRYKELYAAMHDKGSIDTDKGKVDIIELVSPEGHAEEMHFDAGTGLLVYGGETQLGDYRQVDGVKIPFLMRVPFAGLEIVIQLEQVSHNVPIREDAFAEPQSCFTER